MCRPAPASMPALRAFGPIPFSPTGRYDAKIKPCRVIDGVSDTDIPVEYTDIGRIMVAYGRHGLVIGVLGRDMARAAFCPPPDSKGSRGGHG